MGGGRGEAEVDTEWTSALEAAVLRQMVFAFDNYPEAEVAGLLEALVSAASRGEAEAERSLQKLVALTRRMEDLETAAASGRADPEMLADDARSLRSQIRMWGKDGERYTQAGSGDGWLDWLTDLGKNL